MANLGGTYDATGGETMGDRSILPDGEYIAVISKSEIKDAKTAGNRYINLEWEVYDGDCKGRRFWSMLNLWNANATAVEIAQREFNSICHAVGKLKVQDTEELHSIPMRVTLGQRKQDGYDPQNIIKAIKPMNAAPTTSAPPVTSGATSQSGGNAGGNAPWRQAS